MQVKVSDYKDIPRIKKQCEIYLSYNVVSEITLTQLIVLLQTGLELTLKPLGPPNCRECDQKTTIINIDFNNKVFIKK